MKFHGPQSFFSNLLSLIGGMRICLVIGRICVEYIKKNDGIIKITVIEMDEHLTAINHYNGVNIVTYIPKN